MSDEEKRPVDDLPIEGQQYNHRRHNLLLYYASAIVILIVFIATVLPNFVGGSEFLYNIGSLRILYAALGLAAAMITFGVLGDSGALVNLKQKSGITIQISGSAAGFAVFYYLLSSGLSPYKDLEVYLYDDTGNLMQPNDGIFEVTVGSRIRQERETAEGRIMFSLPRSEKSVRLFVKNLSGRLWELDSLSPIACLEGKDHVSIDCGSINLHLKKGEDCLADQTVTSYESSPITTTLETVLDSLKESLQEISVDLPVNVKFSDSVLEEKLHTVKFNLERKNRNARSICEHLAAIENRFNWSRNKREVVAYLSCNTMLVTLAAENIQEGYVSCL